MSTSYISQLDYCCKPKLVPPYLNKYKLPEGSDIRAIGGCGVHAAIIVNFGTCSNRDYGF